MPELAELYESDDTAWTYTQADLLKSGRLDALDIEYPSSFITIYLG